MNKDLKSNIDRNEIAQLATLMGIALDSGLGIYAALVEVVPRADGANSARLQRMLDSLQLGANLYDELTLIRKGNKNRALDELVLKLQSSIQFGTSIADQLMGLARSNNALVAQSQIVQATKKENLMLLPLVFLILPVTVIFAVFPSTQYLNLNY